MKYNKIIGLSFLLTSTLGIIACNNNKSNVTPNNDVYQDTSSNPVANDGYCLLTFDAGEGYYTASGATQTFFQVRKGHNWGRIKNKTGIDEKGTDLTPTGVENTVFKFYQTKDNKAIFDEYVFNEDNITLTAKWGQEYKPTTFSTDSWDQVVEAADKGYDELVTKYAGAFNFDRKDFIIGDLNDPDEVRAKTRYVNIEGLKNPLYGTKGNEDIPNECDWPVRVIGQNHDLIKDSPKSVAALTFEFVYSPIASYGWDYSSSLGHKSWDNSSLKTNLNSYLYLQIEDKLQSGIQTVRKNTDDGTDQDNIGTYDEKLFIPSVSEIASVDELKRNGKVNASSFENSRYEFYANDVHQGKEIIKKTPFVTTTDDEGNVLPTSASAWLRSPSTAISNSSSAITISPNGSSDVNFNEDKVNISHIVCPCFAIGDNPVCAISTNMDEGLVFEGVNYYAKNGVDYVARIKTNDPIGGYRAPANLDGKIKATINGTEKILIVDTDYDYDSVTGKLTINSSAINDATLISIKASPQMDKYQSASWDEVAAKADEGIEAFKQYYGYNIDDSLVGLQKYLTIDGVKYRTRIIDECYDPLADGTGKATLTYEFMDAIGTPDCYDDKTNENFPQSQLNFRLSAFAQDKMPIELAEVTKQVNTKNGNSWELTYYPTKLFPLSTAEMNNLGPEVDKPEYYGEPYDYFTDTTTKNYYKYLPGSKNPVSTWIRTPNTLSYKAPDRPNNCITTSDTISDELTYVNLCTDTNPYVAPAFCIGHSRESVNITFSGATNNFKINGQAPQTIPDVPAGKPYTIGNISTNTIFGEAPAIDKNYVFITNNDSAFNDWDLINKGNNSYDIVINKVPGSGLNINVSFPTEYFAVGLDRTKDVGGGIAFKFEKGKNAPDTELSYCSEDTGGQFVDYTYGTEIELTSFREKVYFKASEGANNTHFANVSDFDGFGLLEEDEQHALITQFLAREKDTDPETSPALRLEGNIMSLLGNGSTTPTTIDANSAFTGMFMYPGVHERTYGLFISDASGLILPATGTSNNTIEARGAYAYMFDTSHITKAPAKIAGFNNYGEGMVSDTYHSMFSLCDIETMPYCDFSKTCPRMCKGMFSHCYYLKDLNNVTTSQFNYDYSESCFESMFANSSNYVYEGTILDVPNSIGSISADAALNCCKDMFSSVERITKTPNMMCNKTADGAFANCFFCCSNLIEATITINEAVPRIGEASDAAYHAFLHNTDPSTYIRNVYIYGLNNGEWPTDIFYFWLSGRVDDGNYGATLHANAGVINSIETIGRGDSTLYESWYTAVLP